jgi:hypothetical protein
MANDSHKADDFKLGSSTITQKDPYVAELEAKLQKIHQQQIDAGRASALKTKGTYKPFRQYINRRCELFEGDTPTNRKEWVVLWKEIINDLALKSVNDFIEVAEVSPHAIKYSGSKIEILQLSEFGEECLHHEEIRYYELVENSNKREDQLKCITLHPVWRYMKEYFKVKNQLN